MKNISLTSVLGFLLSFPGLIFVFMYYATDLLGRGYGAVAIGLLGLAASSLSALFALISLYYVLKGSSSKYLTYFALAADVVFFIAFAASEIV